MRQVLSAPVTPFALASASAFRRPLRLLRSSYLLTRIRGGSSILCATCRAPGPWLMILPSGFAYGLYFGRNAVWWCLRDPARHTQTIKRSCGAGSLPAPPGQSPWRRWRVRHPKYLQSPYQTDLVRAKVQACRRRSAVEYIRAVVTALACAWRQCMAKPYSSITPRERPCTISTRRCLHSELLTYFFLSIEKRKGYFGHCNSSLNST